MHQYRLSKYVSLVPLPDGQGVALHAANQSRVFLNRDLFQALLMFVDKASLSVDELHDHLLATNAGLPDEQIQHRKREQRPLLENLVQYFSRNALIVPITVDEEEFYQRRFMADVESNRLKPLEVGVPNEFQLATFVGLDNIGPVDYDRLERLRIMILGGCLTQYSADAIVALGNRRGFDVSVTTGWPANFGALETDSSDLIILQLATNWLLAPLWDGAPFFDERKRAELLQFMKDSIASTIQEVREKIHKQLILVHGFTRPMVSPLGMHDFRHQYSFERIVFELNEHIRGLIRDDPDVMFVDEERIVANFGKRHLLDHLVAPFSHHGPIDMAMGVKTESSRQETFGISQPYGAAHLFAQEYLDHYITWQGTRRIKCIIVDLDNTLWPANLGESGFDLENEQFVMSLRSGVWAGLHQALRILKERGVLLATASKNTRDIVMEEWERLGEWCDESCRENNFQHILRPDDFVLHEIDWGPKSASVARILETLETTDGAALFIDDHPVEREEVRRAHAQIEILGDNLNTVRSHLLTSPRLQFNHVSSESSNRTTLIRTHLTRVATQKTAASTAEFLSSLGIRMDVKRLVPGASLGRVIELVQRTNQFNTTLHRTSAGEIEQIIRQPESSLFTLEVSDRFGAYGVVGVCILSGNEISSFVMSCRVMALKPAVPFLCTVLAAHGHNSYQGRIIAGPRNQPCRSLFADAGFSEGEAGHWYLASLSDLNPIDAGVYEITVGNGVEEMDPGLIERRRTETNRVGRRSGD